ncbi:MAG: helix-turn-helix domain-containing protein [Gemmatimonadetes bacterium]|nr:helix-turn-helix domain-containing protein [Gemmatimonadota bacterium]MYI66314.1 helix-turn-helix domain-containing protein [Gemmatimonadota bacterium]
MPPAEPTPSLGQAMRRLRLAAGLSQRELAGRLAVDPTYLSHLESDRRDPSVRFVKRFAALVDVPVTSLLVVAMWDEMAPSEQDMFQPVVSSLMHLTEAVVRMPASSPGPLRRLSVQKLVAVCRLSEQQFARLLESREKEYHEVSWEKEPGKTRTLHIPSERLKAVQRLILRYMIDRVPPHPCSACVKGRGNHWAYRRHARHPSMLRLDISDFFPSVGEDAVREAFIRLGAREPVADALVRLVTLPERLPQGAPTSVAVADMVLFPLDVRLAGMAEKHGFTYSRYVDDITLSGGNRLARFEQTVRRIVTDLGWELNEKGGLVGSDQRHSLLGGIVNAKPNVASEYYGRVRSYLRLVAKGREQPDEDDFRKLRSKVEWIVSVNPERKAALHALVDEALTTLKQQEASIRRREKIVPQ